MYKHIFDVESVEVTNLSQDNNEAVFSIYGTRFHMLAENTYFQLISPKSNSHQSVWFNVAVPDIKKTHENALAAGCIEVQAVTDMIDFGYIWMLNQIHKEVSFEDRIDYCTQNNKK